MNKENTPIIIIDLGIDQSSSAQFINYCSNLAEKDFLVILSKKTKKIAFKSTVREKIKIVKIKTDLFVELNNWFLNLEDLGLIPRNWIFIQSQSLEGKPFERIEIELISSSINKNFLNLVKICHFLVPELLRPNNEGVNELSTIGFVWLGEKSGVVDETIFTASSAFAENLQKDLENHNFKITRQFLQSDQSQNG